MNEENMRIALELFDAGKTEERPSHGSGDDGTLWAQREGNGQVTHVRISQQDYPEFYRRVRELEWVERALRQ